MMGRWHAPTLRRPSRSLVGLGRPFPETADPLAKAASLAPWLYGSSADGKPRLTVARAKKAAAAAQAVQAEIAIAARAKQAAVNAKKGPSRRPRRP